MLRWKLGRALSPPLLPLRLLLKSPALFLPLLLLHLRFKPPAHPLAHTSLPPRPLRSLAKILARSYLPLLLLKSPAQFRKFSPLLNSLRPPPRSSLGYPKMIPRHTSCRSYHPRAQQTMGITPRPMEYLRAITPLRRPQTLGRPTPPPRKRRGGPRSE